MYYQVSFFYTNIGVVYADSETESFIIVQGRREKRHSEHRAYFKSFEEAKNALCEYWRNEKARAEHRLNQCTRQLENCQALKEQ